MKMRAWRRRPKILHLRGPYYGDRRVWGKYLLIKEFEVGHDEHNAWTEYLVLRFK